MQSLNIQYAREIPRGEPQPQLRLVENSDYDRPKYRGDIHRTNLRFHDDEAKPESGRELGII